MSSMRYAVTNMRTLSTESMVRMNAALINDERRGRNGCYISKLNIKAQHIRKCFPSTELWARRTFYS